MRAVIQRVKFAKVLINNIITRQISDGILVLIGIEDFDSEKDIEWLCAKICRLRIFDDNQGIMNISVSDINGDIMVISQFTLFASTKKGNRPSYSRASKPGKAIPFYNKFVQELENVFGKSIQTGVFGADMKVELLNDGPVTIIIDTKSKE
jgi:D-tyrosyl-tRNA(Tyr) deacylase